MLSRSTSNAKLVRFRPALESLEGRTVPTSLNFITTLNVGSTLVVFANEPGGADDNNNILIRGDGDTVTVSGFNGTSVQGQTSFTGINNIQVNLKDGTDLLSLGNVNIPGNLTIKGGDGDKSISLYSGSIAGTTKLTTQGGDDTVSILTGMQLGSLNASLGAGDDHFYAMNSSYSGDVSIRMGAGNDDLYLGYLDPSYGVPHFNSPGQGQNSPSVSIRMGAGDDYFSTLADPAPTYAGAAAVYGGAGSDHASIGSPDPKLSLSNFE